VDRPEDGDRGVAAVDPRDVEQDEQQQEVGDADDEHEVQQAPGAHREPDLRMRTFSTTVPGAVVAEPSKR
jgi:hypothetical protein